MNICGACFLIVSLGMALFCCGLQVSHSQSSTLPPIGDSSAKLEQELVAKYGVEQRVRVRRGLQQVAAFWISRDGSEEEFESFVRANFAGDPQTLGVMFNRFETLLEKLDGHMQEIGREFRAQADLDIGPILPFDEVFAAYDPSAHVADDFFGNKLAFTVLLNFPLTTLEQRLTEGERWSRRQWAEARLAERFSKRVPAEVNQAIAQATAEAEQYISQYNIWAHHLITSEGRRLFPPGLRLLSHWNLRDQIKADYSEPRDALARQRTIQQVMERIVTQTIPAGAINNPRVDWNPFSNEVKPAASADTDMPALSGSEINRAPEPNTRYAVLLNRYLARKRLDPYYAAVFKNRDVVLLGIYSQMIDSSLYLPDYPIGHMIAAQVEEQMQKTDRIGPEFERMARLGRIAPDLWMKEAAGRNVSPDALLDAAQKAIAEAVP